MGTPVKFVDYNGFKYKFLRNDDRWCIQYPGGGKVYPPCLCCKTEDDVKQHIDDIIAQFAP